MTPIELSNTSLMVFLRATYNLVLDNLELDSLVLVLMVVKVRTKAATVVSFQKVWTPTACSRCSLWLPTPTSPSSVLESFRTLPSIKNS